MLGREEPLAHQDPQDSQDLLGSLELVGQQDLKVHLQSAYGGRSWVRKVMFWPSVSGRPAVPGEELPSCAGSSCQEWAEGWLEKQGLSLGLMGVHGESSEKSFSEEKLYSFTHCAPLCARFLLSCVLHEPPCAFPPNYIVCPFVYWCVPHVSSGFHGFPGLNGLNGLPGTKGSPGTPGKGTMEWKCHS